MTGADTPVFFDRDPLKFPERDDAVKCDPRARSRRTRKLSEIWRRRPTYRDAALAGGILADHWSYRADDDRYAR